MTEAAGSSSVMSPEAGDRVCPGGAFREERRVMAAVDEGFQASHPRSTFLPLPQEPRPSETLCILRSVSSVLRFRPDGPGTEHT